MRGLTRFNFRFRANRTTSTAHPNSRMKRLLTFAGVTVVALLLLAITGLGSAIANRLIFYVDIARLSMQTPDTKLAMPLPEVAKRQIADTWHEPRGTNRLHEGQDIFAPKGTPILSATNGLIYNIGENNLGGQTVSVVLNFALVVAILGYFGVQTTTFAALIAAAGL